MQRFLSTLVAVFAVAFSSPAWAVKVVTSTQDLAALTEAVGGDDVSVSYLARGDSDPHFVDAKPSYMMKLASADLVIVVGLELEIGWMPSLLTGSRNPGIQPGQPGYLDASAAVSPIEVPTGTIDRSRGDLHPLGNPHYWLDPENGRKVARLIAAKLTAIDPGNSTEYASRLATFETALTDKEAAWKTALAPLSGSKIVGYHSTFDYLAATYGLDVIGFVEPKPGIPPTPSHSLELAGQAKTAGAKLIIVESYHDPRDAGPIANASGARVVSLPASVGGVEGVDSYTALFDTIVKLLTTG